MFDDIIEFPFYLLPFCAIFISNRFSQDLLKCFLFKLELLRMGECSERTMCLYLYLIQFFPLIESFWGIFVTSIASKSSFYFILI